MGIAAGAARPSDGNELLPVLHRSLWCRIVTEFSFLGGAFGETDTVKVLVMKLARRRSSGDLGLGEV